MSPSRWPRHDGGPAAEAAATKAESLTNPVRLQPHVNRSPVASGGRSRNRRLGKRRGSGNATSPASLRRVGRRARKARSAVCIEIFRGTPTFGCRADIAPARHPPDDVVGGGGDGPTAVETRRSKTANARRLPARAGSRLAFAFRSTDDQPSPKSSSRKRPRTARAGGARRRCQDRFDDEPRRPSKGGQGPVSGFSWSGSEKTGRLRFQKMEAPRRAATVAIPSSEGRGEGTPSASSAR